MAGGSDCTQKPGHPHGWIPTTLTPSEPGRTYRDVVDLLIRECGDDFRVIAVDEPETYVEGIGFVMLLAAYQGDQALFDGLYRFYSSKCTDNSNGMMAWRVSCDEIIDPGSATDGDVDVAFSLIVAHEQWGGDYLEKAITILDIIKRTVMLDCDGVRILAPGFSLESGSSDNGLWGGCELMDIMYHTPAFFRVFADVTQDPDWDKLADDTYIALNNAAHPATGLVPDWQSVDGKPGGNSDFRCDFYRYDACRVPWRIALDYLWNGNEQARAWCVKVSDWLATVGAENIVDGYHLDGTPHETALYHNNAFVGGFAVATMAHSQELVDAFASQLGTPALADDDKTWFNLSTRGLYLFTLSGKFWKPSVVAP